MRHDVCQARGARALSDVADQLDALCAATGVPVTGRRPWLQAWADCYPDYEPWVLLVERAGEAVAAAPLARRRSGPLLRVVGLGHGPTDELHLPSRDEPAAEALAEALAGALRSQGPWLLHLQQLPPDAAGTRAALAALPGATTVPGEGLPQVHVGERDPNRYLSRNTRKALAKVRNRLAAEGLEPQCAWVREPEAVRALLPELAAVHRRRDLALRGRSDHSDPRAARFFEHVLSVHADRGEVAVLSLRIDGRLAAYAAALVDGRALRVWDNRLDPDFARLSAGRLANTEVLLHVVGSDELDLLDWMQGEEPYKLQSATTVVPAVDLVAGSSPAVLAGRRAVEGLRAAKRRSPGLTRVWWGWQDLAGRPSSRGTQRSTGRS